MYLDYSFSSGPFLRFSLIFEFLPEMFDHLVCETRDPSLTINYHENKRIVSCVFKLKYLSQNLVKLDM